MNGQKVTFDEKCFGRSEVIIRRYKYDIDEFHAIAWYTAYILFYISDNIGFIRG